VTGFYIGGGLLVLILAFVAYAYRLGRKAVKTQTALEAAERYAETRKEMDDAQDVVGSDPDAARRWLREYGQR
jgi:hypothetical protein